MGDLQLRYRIWFNRSSEILPVSGSTSTHRGPIVGRAGPGVGNGRS